MVWDAHTYLLANESQTKMSVSSIYPDVPWPLVNGVVLENSNLLQKAVCDAYTGVPPASCKAVQSSADGRCKN